MLRRFTVFLASGAFTASASSYHFASIAPPQQHRLPTPAGWQRPKLRRPPSLMPTPKALPSAFVFLELSSCAFF
ncbi:DUF1010 domain-containing protein, partial [Acidovorax sp.]|uniref:DUF1010 domain-containing protein n=1 Tax=Acidovorax sp. TaxID=1872122 RepID=UPI00344F8016